MTTRIKTQIVGLKELREHTERYIRAVQNGQSLTVVRRSLPVFRLSPVSEDESLWETVVDFTKIKKGGVLMTDVLNRL
jgi:prevent-host-death family protein